MRPHRRFKATYLILAIVAVVLFMPGYVGAVHTSNRTPSTVKSKRTGHSANVSAVKAIIKGYEALPSFVPPGPAINLAALKGKTIYTIMSSTAIPFCETVGTTISAVAAKFGVHNVVYPNSGETSQWVQGFDQAISSHASLINVGCGINDAAVAPQIKLADKAGIPVVSAHSYDPSQIVPAGVAAVENAPYKLVGELEADWTIAQKGSNADVLVIDDVADDVSTPALLAGIKESYSNYCSSCKVTYRDVPIPDWATDIGPEVSAALTADPHINYIIPVYDGMVGYVLPAITALGVGGKVKIATFNGTPSVLDELRTGDVVTFDVAEDFPWIGRAIFDQDARVLLHEPPGSPEVAVPRVFIKSNISQAGIPAEFSDGYGTAAQTGFAKLWKG